MEKQSLSLFVCPYCHGVLKQTYVHGDFGIVRCMCDEYPIVAGILFLQKNEAMTNRRVVTRIRQKQYAQALFMLLDGTRIQRFLLFCLFYLRFHFRIYISRMRVLQTLRIVSPNASWFRYLLHRDTDAEISATASLLGSFAGQSSIILDIGCGIGHVFEVFQKKHPTFSGRYIGIDKSPSSLLLARLYMDITHFQLISCSVDIGIPLRDSTVSCVVSLDSLAYIHAKKMVIKEVCRVLKTQGIFYILHMYTNSPKTRFWGYGMDPKELKKLLMCDFQSFSFRNIYTSTLQYGLLKQTLDRANYSCVARKL